MTKKNLLAIFHTSSFHENANKHSKTIRKEHVLRNIFYHKFYHIIILQGYSRAYITQLLVISKRFLTKLGISIIEPRVKSKGAGWLLVKYIFLCWYFMLFPILWKPDLDQFWVIKCHSDKILGLMTCVIELS